MPVDKPMTPRELSPEEERDAREAIAELSKTITTISTQGSLSRTVKVNPSRLLATLDALRARLADAERERDAILLQARSWAMEARTQRHTVNQVGSLLGGMADWQGIAQAVEARFAAGRREADGLRAALRYVEWGGKARFDYCPGCKRSMDERHAADCIVGRALGAAAEREVMPDEPAIHELVNEKEQGARQVEFSVSDGSEEEVPTVLPGKGSGAPSGQERNQVGEAQEDAVREVRRSEFAGPPPGLSGEAGGGMALSEAPQRASSEGRLAAHPTNAETPPEAAPLPCPELPPGYRIAPTLGKFGCVDLFLPSGEHWCWQVGDENAKQSAWAHYGRACFRDGLPPDVADVMRAAVAVDADADPPQELDERLDFHRSLIALAAAVSRLSPERRKELGL